jgi:hypothetical protein
MRYIAVELRRTEKACGTAGGFMLRSGHIVALARRMAELT